MTEKKIDFKVDYSKLNIISEHNTKEPRYPMVLSVPHSGRVFPQEFLDRVDVSLNELRSNEDPFVDELVMEASNLGIPMVALNIGRAFIDVNRDAIEIDPAAQIRAICPDSCSVPPSCTAARHSSGPNQSSWPSTPDLSHATRRRIAHRLAGSDKGVHRRKENGIARRPVSVAGSTGRSR